MTGFLSVTAPAAAPVISVDEIKAQVRQDLSDEDVLIAGLANAASEAVQRLTGKALVTQGWDWRIARPDGRLTLPLSPVQAITSLAYCDPADVVQALDVNDFYFVSSDDVAILEPKSAAAWPAMSDRPDALTVSFTAGFGAASTIPADLRQAALMLAAHWYENRAAASARSLSNVPSGVDYLISLHKAWWKGL